MTAAAETARRRRWHRAAIPLGIAAALLVITGVTYAIEQPDRADPDFLSPASSAPVGASRLADLVRQRGVAVERVTRTTEALVAAERGDATLFVIVPEALRPVYVRALRSLPRAARVVLVEAQARVLIDGRMPVAAGGRRWTTAGVGPGPRCTLPEALAATPAAALRQRYGAVDPAGVELHRCYGNGLLVLRWAGPEFVLIGASDPFRNDRIDEHRNADLATGLLTTRPRLVWLDLHRLEPPPEAGPPPAGSEEEPSGPEPGGDTRGDPGEPGSGDGEDEGDGGSTQSSDESPTNPLWGAFPPWFWVLLVQLLLAAVLVALWRARRLGPPVTEPLPVRVRSAETVLGRGRLYQRARARGPALEILRQATRARLLALLDLPAGAGSARVVSAVAGHTGQPEHEVHALLYGPEPDNDEDLVRMAGELDALLHAVAGQGAPAQETDEGETR